MVAEGTKSSSAPKSQKDNPDAKNGDKNIALDQPAKPKDKPAKPKTSVEEEVSTSTTDDMLPKKSSEEVALILSAEEEGELGANTNEEPAKEESKSADIVKTKRQKKEACKNLWVSNISRTTRAADLKKLFSENFKVESAKIVTNGKCFFGYILLETSEMVQRAVKALNGFNLAGRIIAVSVMRPDLKAAKATVGDHAKRGKEKQTQPSVKESQKIKENKPEESDISKETVKDAVVEKKPDSQVIKAVPNDTAKKPKRQESKPDRRDKIIENLKKELSTASSELRITKRRIRDLHSRLELERSRKLELGKDFSRLESELKQEKRKVHQEREQAEKKRKLDEMRHEDDRRILNKELEECRKLREYLQVKVDEMRMDARRRGRSPVRRSSPRRSDQSDRNLSDRGYTGVDKYQRTRVLHISPPKYEDRQCIVPSPPKITKRSSPRARERSPTYKSNKKPRMDYSASSYSSGPSGASKAPLGHYPPTNSLSAPSKVDPSWNSSYHKMPYRYNPVAGPGSYPMVESQVVYSPRFNTKSMESLNYPKRMPGGPRKY